ncbi:hypothetical protein FRY74_09545 [Vicingus serpentipes]|uniref:Outer membrane protein beta-barrel domain-containing protein n=1 Tax=Vicingus serpentipes TaxID=1926625 RepID=A0A5C6RRZ4_9FLAO|nr:hypothetical protein [Vicingus serpentipes]TXB64685.1 hypothetical protein FRY74_09545 [Vicingus serpentipes]
MKKIIFITILALITYGQCFSQSNTPIFIGFQPNITVEPFYDKGEFDLDIAPVVFEASVGLRTNIKISPIVNYHFGGTTNGVSDIGVFSVLPIFIKSKEAKNERPYGFYLGPVIGFGRNLINSHYTTTLSIEPGYMFETKNRFTISMGLQLGGSYFSYDKEPNKWVIHWGPKFSFGFWIN